MKRKTKSKRQWTPQLRAATMKDRRTKRMRTRAAQKRKAINEQ